jgi:hypothetical protein
VRVSLRSSVLRESHGSGHPHPEPKALSPRMQLDGELTIWGFDEEVRAQGSCYRRAGQARGAGLFKANGGAGRGLMEICSERRRFASVLLAHRPITE